MKKLYCSYGMNTNLEQMALRCPGAVSLGAAVLPGFRFEFKNFATVVPDVENDTDIVLWEITEYNEMALDRLEGYPLYYDKKEVDVIYNGETVTAMTYLMHDDEQLYPPSKSYLDMLIQGYMDHGIEFKQLNEALDRAWVEIHQLTDNLKSVQYS